MNTRIAFCEGASRPDPKHAAERGEAEPQLADDVQLAPADPPEPAAIQPKLRRGFAAMDRRQVREIARKGAKAAHSAGSAHQFNSDEARVAGRKGGSPRMPNDARRSSDSARRREFRGPLSCTRKARDCTDVASHLGAAPCLRRRRDDNLRGAIAKALQLKSVPAASASQSVMGCLQPSPVGCRTAKCARSARRAAQPRRRCAVRGHGRA